MLNPVSPTGELAGSGQDCRFKILGDDPNAGDGTQVLAEECAVVISYNGISHAVMMATPEDLEDFALGYSVTSGVVSDAGQVLDVRWRHQHPDSGELPDSVQLDIQLNMRALHNFKQQRRAQVGTSGCGLCGVEALAQAFPQLPDIRVQPHPLPPLRHLRDLRMRFNEMQRNRHGSGAMHAALYVDEHGYTHSCREDIGRHNALDKLIGACIRSSVNPARGFFAVTSRCSVELVQKIARCGGATLVTLASPTQLGVSWARRYQINLIHLPAHAPARLYSPEPDISQST